MSVSVEGVKGYEYQYKLTLLISLLLEDAKICLLVEKPKSEDALLTIEINGKTRTIEIQVKREKSRIDFNKIASWLCHFEERKSDHNLFQKIIDQQSVSALFVTRGRCSDDIINLKKSLGDITDNSGGYSKSWITGISNAISSLKFGKTAIMSKREEYCKNQIKNLKTNDYDIFNRILIWEEITDQKLEDEIKQLLNKRYYVAQSNCNQAYLDLIEIIKDGRGKASDVNAQIKLRIDKYRIGRPQIEKIFFARNEEIKLTTEINSSGILLLTGLTQCGKSQLAKKIAIHFFNDGFDFELTSQIEDVRRFFSANVANNKIAILEDPWGHIDSNTHDSRITRQLEELIRNKQSHHKLIVTSRREIINLVFESGELDDCSICDYQWKDLTIYDYEVINQYWISISTAKNLDKKSIDIVSKGLKNSKSSEILQIGQLKFLLTNSSDKLHNKPYSDLVHLARKSSQEIAKDLKSKSKEFSEILGALAICVDTINQVDICDLAYILSDEEDGLSFRKDDIFVTSSKRHSKFPSYETKLTLTKDQLEAIEYLEEKQFIYVADESIVFSHPNYFEAGRYSFISKTQSAQNRLLSRFSRAISCKNSNTCRVASSQFQFIYDKINDNQKVKLQELALRSIHSMFPVVEDNSILFLTSIIQDLSEKSQQQVIRKVQSGSTHDSYIYWHNNQVPFICSEGSFSNFFGEDNPKLNSRVELQLSKKTLPTAYDSWHFLQGISRIKYDKVSELNILLLNNESFIREKTAYEMFKYITLKDKEIVSTIFNDNNPSVVFSAIRASFINWFNYSKTLQKILFRLIKTALNQFQVSIRTFNLISTFSIDYGSESVFNWRDFNADQKRQIWKIWGELFPITFSVIPLGLFINSARFGSTMDEAIKYLDIKQGIKVMEAWLNRIKFQLENSRELDEFEMAIADNLLLLTEQDYLSRQGLYVDLLTTPNTSFLLSNLKWIISNWNKLHKTEKNQLINLLKQDREDVRWIRALFLTRYDVKSEFLDVIFNDADFLDNDIGYIINNFPEQLLRDSLNMYCGFPQPLWFLAVHHTNEDFFPKLIRHILMNQSNVGFDICLQEFLSNAVNGFSRKWEDGTRLWKNICENAQDKSQLLESLIYNTANCTCNIYTAKKLWKILIKACSNNERINVIDGIAKNIELLQQSGHPDDIIQILAPSFFIENILPKIMPDYLIIQTLHSMDENTLVDEDFQDKFVELILNILADDEKQLRFHGTYKFIQNFISKNKLSAKTESQLNELINTIDDVGEELLNEKAKRDHYQLENWAGR